MRLTVIHEDPDVVAIDKPVGLASIPERDLAAPSAQRLLEAQRGERLWVVHRLDKEVSGVLLFARNAAAHRALSLAFEQRRVAKTYLAWVHGELAEDALTIDRPIAEFGSGRMGVHERGKPSRTEVRVRERGGGFTLVEAKPVTGRRHQLRVHLYSAGHAIVGDPRYGDPALQRRWPRLLLHGWRLAVEVPELGRALAIEAAPPPSFAAPGEPP